MGKWCNFDTNDDGQLICVEHSPTGAPALCTHAAADLERRVEKLEQNLLGMDALLGGNTVASINGEVRGQVWRIHKVDELKQQAAGFAKCYKNAWQGFQMIRETLETLGLVGAVQSEEGVVLERGPEPIHEAEALVEAIRALESRLAGLEEEWAQAIAALDIALAQSREAERALNFLGARTALQPDIVTKARIALDDYRLSESRLAQAEAREAAMRDTFQRIIRHATAEKSPETAPPRNRLQNIVCLAEAALSPSLAAPKEQEG